MDGQPLLSFAKVSECVPRSTYLQYAEKYPWMKEIIMGDLSTVNFKNDLSGANACWRKVS